MYLLIWLFSVLLHCFTDMGNWSPVVRKYRVKANCENDPLMDPRAWIGCMTIHVTAWAIAIMLPWICYDFYLKDTIQLAASCILMIVHAIFHFVIDDALYNKKTITAFNTAQVYHVWQLTSNVLVFLVIELIQALI